MGYNYNYSFRSFPHPVLSLCCVLPVGRPGGVAAIPALLLATQQPAALRWLKVNLKKVGVSLAIPRFTRNKN
jgi:hypothetical protein